MSGDFAGGLAEIEAAIADARKWGGEVNQGALASMHVERACALTALDRGGEAARSVEIARSREAVEPTAYIRQLLCMDDLAGARSVALRALGDEETRSEMLAWLRPPGEEPFPSDYARLLNARSEQLRSDPAVRAAAAKHAILPSEPLNAGAPPEDAGGA